MITDSDDEFANLKLECDLRGTTNARGATETVDRDSEPSHWSRAGPGTKP